MILNENDIPLSALICDQYNHTSTIASLSEENADALSWSHKFLTVNGWVREYDRRQSAMFEKIYIRNNITVFISGWHGLGKPRSTRHWGSLKLIFDINSTSLTSTNLCVTNSTVGQCREFLANFKDQILLLK